ncbi:penicillin-binding transpeptidase domain-containing protein [Intestinimonas butyriciproducens]|uniref:Penicillin-binding protein 2 (PBP-2) n=1 Tax=Intestinimonas butyriciproducens TaxID=1297617 RepID=A0A0S2VZT4_9FIRM|nr:penicillin-binding transpeptidase domain-containing protein [Intestinimonas butyriciproducens]ALP92619.1 Penicillin-binding protein 2 (PBP-2) [Intestinimonas butyriciproducens]
MNGKKEPMMDGRQFHVRVRGVMVLLAAVLVGFLWVLYDLQYVHGAEYLEQSRRKIAKTETVEASRGQILDRYGRVLVGNRASYNVSLDTSFMGEDRNTVLLRLLDICREESVTWSDTLPVSRSAPYVFTAEGAYGNLRKYAEKMKWDGLVPTAEELEALQSAESPALPSAERLLAKLRETYQVDPALSDGEARDLVGVLYELALRSREITWSSYVFAQDVEMAFIVKVKEASLSGVSIDTTTVREYNTSYAAHLLGRVGLMDSDEWNNIYQALDYPYNASVGKDGMEQAFESYLHGVPGKRAIETNDQGKVVSADDNWKIDERTGEPQAPQPGCNVISTLDIKLQEAVERALADGVGALKSEDTQGAAAVVIDVNDGGVLASASYPTYDLSTFLQNYTELANDPLNPLFNRATQGVYPPGSTFKMVTAIAGLQEGVITPTDEILDTGRYTYYKDYQPQCWYYRQYGRTHGKENVSEAIRDSCNIFFYDVGRRLGISLLDEYAQKFGLGEYTGIEVYESKGHVAGPGYTESLGQKWYDGNTLPAAIGQENNQFTPIQLANYVATLANGGTHYSAHLLKEVKSSDFSQVVYQYEPEVLNELDLDPENLEAVTRGMLMVTQPGGSAYSYGFNTLDIQVAAKTGSAQVSSATESNAVFVCFAPYEDPEIALAIVVEKGGSGSTLSSIAVEILDYYFSSGSGMETVEGENTLLR